MKVKDMPYGSILWSKEVDSDGEYTIYGIMGMDLPEEFYEKECEKVVGNRYDYELVEDYENKC